jgi:hypothetical protein
MKTTAPLLLAGLLLFTGCAGILPLPVSSTKVEYGRQLKPAQVAFIQPGHTTRAEVVAALGTNYHTQRMARAISYSWEMKGGGAIWWWFVVCPYGAKGDSGYWTGGWRAFFVAFDDQGVVQATAFKSLSTRRSLDEHLDKWVCGLPVPTQLASIR